MELNPNHEGDFQAESEPEEVFFEQDPNDEPIGNEDMQEDDYRIYEDFDANHQADLSALEQQSSIGYGESQVIGGYATPTAADMDLLEYETAYGEPQGQVDPALAEA